MVVWDMDGTIIDSYGVFSAVVKEAAELSGKPVPSEETIKHNFHGTLDETITAIFNMVDDEATAAVLMDDFLRIQERYYQRPDEHVFEDSYNLAKRLHAMGIDQVVATNRKHEGRGTASPRYLIGNSKMRSFISDIACGDEVEFGKPNPLVLANLAVAQGRRGDEMIVIGDQFVDAKLAQNLGCKAILVSRHPEPIPHLDELGDYLKTIQIVSSLDEVNVE